MTELDSIEDFQAQIKQRIDLKKSQQSLSLNNDKLDGSIKKNTSFIKKLKVGITFSQLEQLKSELKLLKVDKYLEEIVGSIADNIYKTSSDVWAAVELSFILYTRFNQVQQMLVQTLLKSFGTMLKSLEKEKEEQARIQRLKSTLKFLFELYMVGMVPEEKSKNLLPNLLKFLLVNDKDLKNAQVVFAFCKAYGMYLLPNQVCSSQGIDFMLVESRDLLLNESQREKCFSLLSDYFEKVKTSLLKQHHVIMKFD